MEFDYFYPEESENFVFYRTPKIICTDKRFRCLSSDARLLYGILLDRIGLSRNNNWIDEEGHIYVYMTIVSIEEALGICHQKACRVLGELVEFGLVKQKKQGQGKPARLYVMNFGRVWNSYLQKYENHTCRSMEIIPTEVCKSYSNKTEINKTEMNDINPILSGRDEDKDGRSGYHEYLMVKLDMAALYERYPYDKETLDAILNLVLDVICSKRKTIRIAGDDKPVSVVKAQFLKLNLFHIEYVMECLKRNSAKVRNMKQYLLATIYNAPITMQSFYRAWVNSDMAKENIQEDQ